MNAIAPIRRLGTRWMSLPHSVNRWSVCNAIAALAGAALSVATRDLRPALLVALSLLAWAYAAAAHSGARLANMLTAARLGILFAALGLVPEHGAWVAGAALVNFALDGVDGWVARKLDQASEFGARFDMEGDSHTVLLLDLQLVIHAGYPSWVLCAGVLRYAFVLSRFVVGPREPRERRSNFARWVFSLVYVSRTFACLPGMHDVALPLLAIATLAVCASFAPDFYGLRSGPPSAG
jgi:phosphatidylglycerophosphate synthase